MPMPAGLASTCSPTNRCCARGCGAVFGATGDSLIGGLIAGILGAVAGTLGGYEFRVRLVRATGGKDLPIALLEDAIAIGGAFLIVHPF